MTKFNRRWPAVVCPKCEKMGRLYVDAKVSKRQPGLRPSIRINHYESRHTFNHYLRQADFPELYQLFFPIVLSPRMERIMEATSGFTGADAEREGRDW